MKVKVMQVGPIGTNCYILEDEATNKAAVIDPGDEGDRILSVLKEDGVQVEYILLTHGHYDHTTAVPELIRALPQAEVYICLLYTSMCPLRLSAYRSNTDQGKAPPVQWRSFFCASDE